MNINAIKLSELLGGEWVVKPSSQWSFETIAISKPDLKLEKSNLFFALDKKINKEGISKQVYYEKIVKEAAAGLSGFVVEEKIENLSEEIPQLLVENTYEALKKLAEVVREKYKGNVVAIKGPAINESTKNMLNSILSCKGHVVSTKRNYSMITDIPLTIVSGINKPDYMILEIDVSQDEINANELAQVSKPNITIINSLGDLKEKSPVEINRAITKICDGIISDEFVILNKEIDYFNKIKTKLIQSGAKILTYGLSEDTDICLIESTRKDDVISAKVNIWEEVVEYEISLLDKEELLNSLAVIGTAWLLNLDIEEASKELKVYKKRERIQ